MKKRVIEIGVKVVVAALTAFLTAITTTTDCALGSAANHRGQAHTDRSKMLSLGSSCVPLVASGKAERP